MVMETLDSAVKPGNDVAGYFYKLRMKESGSCLNL
jgi:hypothetical protein